MLLVAASVYFIDSCYCWLDVSDDIVHVESTTMPTGSLSDW